jgi:predicted alpha/beta hydrolase
MYTWFEPETGSARAVVVFAPAMGVRQDYYAEFADYLAAHQFLVGTMDYRAMGFNEPASLRGEKVTFMDWQVDIENLLESAAKRASGLPLILCGHSLGGQLLGTLRNRRHIDAVLTVASGTGYWGHNPKMRLQLLYLWYFAMPLMTRLCGYFPGRRLNKVGNLPREIALTWARWCRDPRYLMGDPAVRERSAFDQVRLPMLSLSFADDDYIPKAAVEHLHGFYTNAQIERRHVHPHEVGSQRIGHFGFFKLGGAHPLWQQTVAWLETHALGGKAG